MLFDTGEGYFAFCVSAEDSIRGRITPGITPDNVLGAVKTYLDKEKERAAQRKKILIVDDSDFMRERIRQLLGDYYELIEASSSISAIKKITVNSPDLILLDSGNDPF